MPYDLALDRRTGDFMFTANRDVMAIGGAIHIEQRILTRLRIKRGLWVYDVNRDLGSRLDLVTTYQPDRAAREIPALVREALAPMLDIEVGEIAVLVNAEDSKEIAVQISYRVLSSVDSTPETITIPLTA